MTLNSILHPYLYPTTQRDPALDSVDMRSSWTTQLQGDPGTTCNLQPGHTASLEDFIFLHAYRHIYSVHMCVHVCRHMCVQVHVCMHTYGCGSPKLPLGVFFNHSLLHLLRQCLLPGQLALWNPHLCLHLSAFMWVLGIQASVLIAPSSFQIFRFSLVPLYNCLGWFLQFMLRSHGHLPCSWS